MKKITFQIIWTTMILILVFTTSVYAAYAFDTRITTTTRSITDIKSYDETKHYNATRVVFQDDSGIKRIKDNLEVTNRTEIPNAQMLPEFIASSINGNLTVEDSNQVRSNPQFILIDNQSGTIGYALPWENSSKSCVGNFICRANLSTGWQDNTSLQVSTKHPHNINGTWSSIYGKEIGVNPKERYELVTHMKLNDVARNSHIGIEGFNETLKNWNQFKQCPPGVNGSLEWHQFSCEVTIPDNTTKIRPILNAGWSSLKNEEAVTFFDDIYMIRLTDLALPWENSSKSCVGNFICRANLSTGWQDNTSLQVSTKHPHNINGTWSSIYGKEIGVNPKERYELVTHMKLNDVAKNSHIGIEGFDETLKNWNQFRQCPPGVNGSLEWHQFSCEVTIPDNTTKIRPILNAGWSSLKNEEAVTFFDDIYMIRLTDLNSVPNVPTIINDPNLNIEVVTAGLKRPTSMAFLGPDDILVLEKRTGNVHRIINGTMLPEPLLDLNVGNIGERGLLGIAIAPKNENGDRNGTSSNTTNTTHVFLYLTESKDGDNYTPEPLSNHLYRYDLKNNKLVNPKLLLELPRTPKIIHNGGIVAIGPDNYVYTVVGDLEGSTSTKAQNFRDGPEPDGRGGVLRMTQNGQIVNGTGILGDNHPLDMYYAYGIRNSFGMDFDPITGKLWDTENGPNYGDEINLVEPGFNSGWQEVQGHWNQGRVAGDIAQIPDDLVDFDGKGKYSDPEYEWSETVGPTALKFLNSDKLGKEYENDMFVGDFKKGNIYHFELNKDRTKLNLDSAPEYRLNEKTIFAKGFSGVTDIEVGPDGYLYIVSINQGKIYRIVPNS